MKVHQLAMIFVVLGDLQIQHALAACTNVNVSDTRGFIFYGTATSNIENCNWIFWTHQQKSDVAFVIKLIDFRGLHRPLEEFRNNVTLPDGITNPKLENKMYWKDKARCWVYTTAATGQSRNCMNKIATLDKCESGSLTNQQWPPQIQIQFSRYAMLMQYELMDCQAQQGVQSSTARSAKDGPLSTLASKIGTTSKKRKKASISEPTETITRTSKLTKTTTTIARGDQNQCQLQAAGALFYVVAALAVLLAFTAFLLCIALYKLRKLKSCKTEAAPRMPITVETVDAPSSGNTHTERANVDSSSMVVDGGNRSTSVEAQAVDNVLYGEARNQAPQKD